MRLFLRDSFTKFSGFLRVICRFAQFALKKLDFEKVIQIGFFCLFKVKHMFYNKQRT